MKLFITTLVLASLAACSYAVGPLSVQGNKVLVNGRSAMLRGNSLFWSNNGWGGEKFYNPGVVNWLRADFKANIVRAAMGVDEYGGYLTDRDSNRNRVITVVDAAIRANMYVIIDWHSHYAHQYQAEAIAFFQDMARRYGHTNNVIYEIFNEPMTGVNWWEIKSYAIPVIQAIRAIDPDNLIVVGTPNWSQDVDIAANDPITGFVNIAYALHFYAGGHGEELRNKARTALQKNVALFVTEWGSVNPDGNGGVAVDEAKRWMRFLKQHGISHCNWSINDKPEGASVVKPGVSSWGRWSPNDLTEAGNFIRDLLRSNLQYV